MIKPRAAFVFIGYVQRRLLLAAAVAAALGLLLAAALQGRALAAQLHSAAFSAHLAAASSGELIRQTLLEVLLAAAGISVLAGCVTMVWALAYLEALCQALAEGLESLARGDNTMQLAWQDRRWGREILQEFNAAAAGYARQADTLRTLLTSARTATQLEPLEALPALEDLHHQLAAALSPSSISRLDPA